MMELKKCCNHAMLVRSVENPNNLDHLQVMSYFPVSVYIKFCIILNISICFGLFLECVVKFIYIIFSLAPYTQQWKNSVA